MVSPFLFSLDATYIPYISTPKAQNKENIIPYINNGFIIKLYGVRSETNGIIIAGNNKIIKIILYFHGILFFIVNHHCIKLQGMTRNFYTHMEPDYMANLSMHIEIYHLYYAQRKIHHYPHPTNHIDQLQLPL